MSEVVEAPKRRVRTEPAVSDDGKRTSGRLADAALLVGFLALAFLLGVFPLKDTDFWWHLRTGDLIRQTGTLPTVDTYTFGAEGHRWVDLHWIFQVLLSLGYERVGITGLNVAKCLVTCLAVGLLVSAKRREWPLWAMIVGWLPALLALGGRMYVRPETLTLLYLSMYLAILFRVDDRPRLAYLLPIVQVAWVNTQGLFVLGPAILGASLVGATLRPGAFASGRRSWWRTMMIATGLVGLACVVNPYGLTGALYPIKLAGTMGNPVFSKSIAELKPLDDFIKETGLTNVPVQIHLATVVVGILSFLIPILWRISERTWRPPVVERIETPAKSVRRAKAASKAKEAPAERRVAPSVFRLILFVAFTVLSWKATRNSHQFAAVVGTVTAWNLGEWAAEVARSRAARGRPPRSGTPGRVLAFGATAGLLVAVGSGAFYAWTAEGRTVGLGEEPHWFPREAVAFAGRADMPARALCFHDGHAAFYEYKYAPDRKVYIDARLEVAGPELYQRYIDLQAKIAKNLPGWEADLDAMGRPVVLVDNIHATLAGVSATLLTSKRYRCVWIDPVASLFVHEAYAGVTRAHAIDLAARHFGRGEPAPATDPSGEAMLAKTSWNTLHSLIDRASRGGTWRGLVWSGLDHARAVREADPDGFDGWKWAGMIEYYRDPPGNGDAVPRFRHGFDPVFDLSAVRASYAFRRALRIKPDDGNALVILAGLHLQRGMFEPALGLFDRMLATTPTSSAQRASREGARLQRSQIVGRLGDPPGSLRWANLSELDRLVNTLYAQGRVESVADLLESAYPKDGRPWEVADRLATIRLHLGEPDSAERHWAEATTPPSEAVRQARLAACRLAMADHAGARDLYRGAARLDPTLFEAQYGLAVLESDLGRAAEALEAARLAARVAPHAPARSAIEALIEAISPHVGP